MADIDPDEDAEVGEAPSPTLRESLRNPNPFDKACRNAVQEDPLGFLRWLDPELFTDVELVGWIDVRAQVDPDACERIGDKLAWLRDPGEPGRPWAVSIEFQTQPRQNTLNRALNYVSQFRLHLVCEDPKGAQFLVLPIIIHLTGGIQPAELDMTPRAARSRRRKRVGTRMEALVRVMSRVRAHEVLQGIEAGPVTSALLYWISLMKGGGDKDIMVRWSEQAKLRIHPEKRANLAITAATFAEAAGRKPKWLTFLKEWNPVESTVFNEFAAAREARALARGRLEGEAKGKMEGEIEGRRQALHSMLMRVLKKRWKQEPPADLIQRIEAEENEAKLQSWMDEAVTAKSFAAFRKTAGL